MPGPIPRDFIDELLRRVDIVDVIESYVPLRKAGSNYQARCPFHQEKTPSFTVSPEKQFYHCFGCGAHGSAISFLMEHEGMGFVEAVRDLAARAGLKVPDSDVGAGTSNAESHDDLYALLEETSRYFRSQLREHAQAERAIAYLKKRGLTGEIAAAFDIGYAPPGWDNLLRKLGGRPDMQARLLSVGLIIKRDEDGRCYDRFRDRVMFPIRDRRGRVIGFGGRVLGDETPKYLNSPESPVFHKGQELYGLYEARKAQRSLTSLIVVEGYMDVVALHQFDVKNAVATLGTAVTPQHVEKLFRTCPEVVFCFDGDNAGRTAAWRALEHTLPAMREGRQARFMFLPEADDPDTLVRREGTEKFAERMRNALPLSQFFFDRLTGEVDMTSLDGRARLAERARPLLATLPEGIFKQMMINELAARTAVEKTVLQRAMGGSSETRSPTPRQRPATAASSPMLATTPARRAIALLLQRPDLAEKVTDYQWLHGSQSLGCRLLRELLELLTARPHLTTGAILEHWRGREEAPYLSKLAGWTPPIPAEGLEKEFLGAIAVVESAEREQRTEALLQKPLDQLTADERQELLHTLKAGPRRPAP